LKLHQENAHLSKEIGERERSLLNSEIVKAIGETRDEKEQCVIKISRIKEELEKLGKQQSKTETEGEYEELLSIMKKLDLIISKPQYQASDDPQ